MPCFAQPLPPQFINNEGNMNSIVTHKGSRKHPHVVNHAHQRSDGGDAFLKDPSGGLAPSRTNDELAETLAEQFVGSITGGQSSDGLDDVSYTEEIGGPFITTLASREFALGVDDSNPRDAEAQALPMVMSEARNLQDDEEPERDA
jgi:hypothetical protein